MSAYYTAADHFALLPALLLSLFGCAALFFRGSWALAMLVAGELFTAVSLWRQWQAAPVVAFQGALTIDGLALVFSALFVFGALICGLVSLRYEDLEAEQQGDYFGLLLLAQAGMFLLAAGTELVTLFVGLELMAVSFYILVGFARGERRSTEAALKYLLLGAFSTGFLVYGFSLLYGLAGSTRLDVIARSVASVDASDPMVLLALLTTAVGLFFKVAAAPFHMWTPDAYEGAPTPVAAYLSVASKAASFALLLRMLWGPLTPLRDLWEPLIITAALASLTVGNLAALTQDNVKRMLAYSSIGHSGYILLALAAGPESGYRAALIYTVIYTLMNLGAFLVLVSLRRGEAKGEYLDEFAGLMRRRPVHAVLMLTFLLALAGLPPTAGFWAKWVLFAALIEAGQYALAVIGALYVAVSLYYYFRVVRAMFMGDRAIEREMNLSWRVGLSLAATGAATIGLGLFPEPVLEFVTQSAGLR